MWPEPAQNGFLGCTKPVTNFIPKPNVKHNAYQKGDLVPRSASLDQRYIGNSERHCAFCACFLPSILTSIVGDRLQSPAYRFSDSL